MQQHAVHQHDPRTLNRFLAIACSIVATTALVLAPTTAFGITTASPSCTTLVNTQLAAAYATAQTTHRAHADLTPSSPEIINLVRSVCDLHLKITRTTHVRRLHGTPPPVTGGADSPRTVHSNPGIYANSATATLTSGAPILGSWIWSSSLSIVFDSSTAPWNCVLCENEAWQGLGWSNTQLNPWPTQGIGFAVTVVKSFWSGSNPSVYNDYGGGGNGPLTATEDFDVSFIFYGAPIHAGHSITINVYGTGSTSVTSA